MTTVYQAIMDAVEAKWTAISGIKKVYRGRPEPMPGSADFYPLVILEAGVPVPQRMTFGNSGEQQMGYPIGFRLVLGAADAKPDIVQARLLALPDRVRAAFDGTDVTLGGLCYDSAITQPQDNLTVYRDLTQPAEIRWRFAAMVQTTPGTPAS